MTAPGAAITRVTISSNDVSRLVASHSFAESAALPPGLARVADLAGWRDPQLPGSGVVQVRCARVRWVCDGLLPLPPHRDVPHSCAAPRPV